MGNMKRYDSLYLDFSVLSDDLLKWHSQRWWKSSKLWQCCSDDGTERRS